MSGEKQGLLAKDEEFEVINVDGETASQAGGTQNEVASSGTPGVYAKLDVATPTVSPSSTATPAGGLDLGGRPSVNSDVPPPLEPLISPEMEALQTQARREADCFILARSGKFEEILAIAEADASVLGFRDADNHGFIHWAALNGDSNFIEKILSDGWPVDVRAKNGQTALMWAALKGHVKIINILLKFGADINAEDSLGATAATLSIQHRELESFLLLVAYDKKVLESKDVNGCKLMHWAAYKGDLQAIKMLEYFLCSVDVVDNLGMSPLHRAVSACQLQVCDYLISKKCNPYARNNAGENCFDLAKKQENDYIKESLHSSLRKIGVKPKLEDGDVEMQDATDTDFLTRAANGEDEENKDTSIRGTFKALRRDLLKDKSGQIFFPIFFLVSSSLVTYLYISEQRTNAYELVPSFAYTFEVILPTVLCIFIWCVKGDPGIIKARTIGNSAIEELQKELKEQITEESISDLSRVCTTCWILKDLRTKHCSECNVCVCEFDHHCVWLNNCVGGGNHRRFIAFTALDCTGQFCHLIITWYVLKDSLPGDRSFFMSFIIAWTSMPLMCLIIVLHLIIIPWVFVLTMAQLRLVTQNMSTNEMMNIHRYDHFWARDRNGGRQVRNPFDKGGAISNCLDFWFKRNRSAKGSKADVIPEPTVYGHEGHGHSHGGEPCHGHGH